MNILGCSYSSVCCFVYLLILKLMLKVSLNLLILDSLEKMFSSYNAAAKHKYKVCFCSPAASQGKVKFWIVQHDTYLLLIYYLLASLSLSVVVDLSMQHRSVHSYYNTGIMTLLIYFFGWFWIIPFGAEPTHEEPTQWADVQKNQSVREDASRLTFLFFYQNKKLSHLFGNIFMCFSCQVSDEKIRTRREWAAVWSYRQQAVSSA